MTQGFSLIEALLALLLLSCGLLFACTGVIKGLQQSQQAMLQVQLEMALTDLWHSHAAHKPNDPPASPSVLAAMAALQRANPSYQFHLCQQHRVMSWSSARPLTKFRASVVCQANDNQAVELSDAPRF